MSANLTPQGTEAYQLLSWAYNDLAANLAAARTRIAELWDEAADQQARNEIGDVATQLSRLAGSAVTMPAGTSITDQLGSHDDYG